MLLVGSLSRTHVGFSELACALRGRPFLLPSPFEMTEAGTNKLEATNTSIKFETRLPRVLLINNNDNGRIGKSRRYFSYTSRDQLRFFE